VLLDRRAEGLARALDVAELRVADGGEALLPGRRREDDAGLGPDGEDRRPRLGGDRAAQRARAAEDDRPGRRVDLLAVEREGRAALDDDVHLLVVVRL